MPSVPLSPMCPTTPLWQEIVSGLVDRLVNEVGVKAVYIDQISAAAAKRCFSTEHGHPLGGGEYWIQGYRELIRKCRQRLPADAALTTEENADPWNDLLQGWLMVNTRENGGEIIPLYPAVYGGRAISFGFQYIQGEDFTAHYPFRLKMARALVFGSQLGWVGSQVLDPANVQEAECLKNYCRVRQEAHAALQLGEMLPPVVLQEVGTVQWVVKREAQETTVTQPAVCTSAWLTPDGKRTLVFANVADQDQAVVATIGKQHLGGSETNPATLTFQNDQETVSLSLTRIEEGRWSGRVTIPARNALALTLQN